MGKKVFVPVFLVFLLSLVLTSVAGAADPTLVGWWKLDETSGTVAADSSGYGNNGTVGGTAQWVQGIMGNALNLNGSSYVAIDGVVNDITGTNITLSVWIKTTSSSEGNVFAANDASSGYALMFGIQGSNPYRWDGADAQYAPAVNDNQWHMLTLVRNGGTGTIYVDGTLRATWASSFTWTGITRWSIGQEWDDANPSDFYTGAVDDVRIYNRALTPADILKVMKGGDAGLASVLTPADKATDVPRDAVLSWTAGEFAKTHDVYFGTVLADVNTASRTSAKGVLASQDQADTTFDPAGSLAYGQTYYWRVDEVNAAPSSTIFKGELWSFTAEPYGYPVKPAAATASSSQLGMGPEKTIDGSGLDSSDQHGAEATTMWLSAGTPPNWIQYQFDKVYKFHDLKVWNSNQMIEGFMGFGAKGVKIEYSSDGTAWTELAKVPEFAKAPGLPTAATTTVSLGGIQAKFVKLTINGNWGGLAPQTGLSEVRFSYVPVQAKSPQPANAATGVAVDASLTWRPGREAGSHKVFVGADQAAVAGGTAAAQTVTDPSFTPSGLNFGTTYYWKVDEVNTVTYPGDVWSFTTQTYTVVEDFESYNDTGNRLYDTWIDGLTDGKSGSQVGYDTSPFAEGTIIHGGKQSMPFLYNNAGAVTTSEATRTFASAQDWTRGGAKTLVLYFYGDPANAAGQVYVKINGAKVVFSGANAVKTAGWTQWNIGLAATGVNLKSVTKLTIGVEGSGKGKLLVDDLLLYANAPAAALGATLDLRIAAGPDDAEEHLNAGMDVTSSDLEIVHEDAGSPATDEQLIGMRWLAQIAKGAGMTKAYIEFQLKEIASTAVNTAPVNVIIEGQLDANPPAFTTAAKNITNRPRTKAQVKWTIPTGMAVGDKFQTPDLSSILKELTSQSGWASGNALVIILRDDKSSPSTGLRCVWAYDGSTTAAPLLHMEVTP